MTTWEDRVVSLLAIAATAWIGLMVAAPAALPSPHVPVLPQTRIERVDHRVIQIATAIATAEGYFAAGTHDGRSLPYRLNNPGALKKPALGAAALPTWRDTGLIEFPSAEQGWAALHHQVRLMLRGGSRVYARTDDLWLVGSKYADGDTNWGRNVAALLGLSPSITLEQLARERVPHVVDEP